MNDSTGIDGPTRSFGRMTAMPRIYDTPVMGFGPIDKSVSVRPSFFRIPANVTSGDKDTLHPFRETS